MKFARHGHSCCAIMDRYILVSGSRKEVNQAANRAEIYDTQLNEWMELSKINIGRHYHSSTNMNNKYVFIFGGIENSTKKYSNSIERLEISITNYNNQWEVMDIPHSPMIDTIPARQGAGMCQISPDEIVIVGGFNGKFLPDHYIIKLDNRVKVQSCKKHLNSFQSN